MVSFSLLGLISSGKMQIPTNLFLGIFMIITPLFLLSEKSIFSPKVKITNEHVLLKNGFWSRSKKLPWATIQQIVFGSYKIIFQMNEKNHIFQYDSDSEVSIQIKNALREGAEEKNIPVIGG